VCIFCYFEKRIKNNYDMDYDAFRALLFPEVGEPISEAKLNKLRELVTTGSREFSRPVDDTLMTVSAAAML